MKNPFAHPQPATASFLPEDYVARQAELRANLLSLVLFAVVMFGVVAAFFFTNRRWIQVRDEQQAINVLYTQEARRIEQLKMLEAQKASMLRKAEVTTALIERVPRSVLLAELITRMPEDITLLELQLKSQRVTPPATTSRTVANKPARVRTLSEALRSRSAGAGEGTDATEAVEVIPPQFTHTLVLVGVGRANSDIADYVTALKACPLLEQVELQFIRETVINKLALRRFEIVAKLRSDADGRRIEAPERLRLAEPGDLADRVAPPPSQLTTAPSPRRPEE